MKRNKDKEKEEKPVPLSEPDYSFLDSLPNGDKSVESRIEEKLIEEEEKRKQEETIHILDIAKNPPKPDYMKAELRGAELKTKDEDGDDVTIPVVVLPLDRKGTTQDASELPGIPTDTTVFVNANGDTVQVYDPIFDINLKQQFDAQVSDCASTIFPMLMDEYVQLALDEKKAWTPEKRKEEFKWWWVLILLLVIIPMLLITLTVLPGFFGG